MRSFWKTRLPAILWTALLLLMSGRAMSSSNTGRGLAALIFGLLGHDASMMTIDVTNFFLRKIAHLTGYAIECLLILRAVRNGRSGTELRWILQALALTLLVAAVDEFNQAHTLGRTGMTSDVVLDFLGGSMAMMTVWMRRRA